MMAARPTTSQVQVTSYVLLDACSKELVDKLQHAMRCMANVVALLDSPSITPALGLSMIRRNLGGKDVQLQVLLQPQAYNLRDWHLALARLQPSDAHQQADDKKLAMAIKALLDHLKAQKQQETHKTIVQHLHVIAHRFSFTPTYGKLLQEAASNGIHVDFCCVAPSDAASSTGEAATASIAQFFAAVAAHENATCCSFACNDHSINQMLLEWVSEEFGLPQPTLQLVLPKPIAGRAAFLCSFAQLVARVKGPCQSTWLCPCHAAPVLPASSTAGVMCSVSRQGLPASSCKLDKPNVQLGHHTHLRLSAFSSVLPKLQHLHAAAGAEPALQVLEVVSTIRLQDVNQAAVYGRAQLLRGISRDLVGDRPMPDAMSQDSDTSVFAAVTVSLLQDHKALLATSLFDTDTGTTSLLKTHYVLRPTGVPGDLLCCKLASAEQLLAFDEPHEAAPSTELVAEVAKELGAWQPAGVSPVGFMATSLAAGYHDLINQIVRDSQKPTPPPAAPAPAPAVAGPAAAPGPAAAIATAAAAAPVAPRKSRMAQSRDVPACPAGADQNQQPAGGPAQAGRAAVANLPQAAKPPAAPVPAAAASAAAAKGKATAGRGQRQSGNGTNGASNSTRNGRVPLQALQLTRK